MRHKAALRRTAAPLPALIIGRFRDFPARYPDAEWTGPLSIALAANESGTEARYRRGTKHSKNCPAAQGAKNQVLPTTNDQRLVFADDSPTRIRRPIRSRLIRRAVHIHNPGLLLVDSHH